MPLENTFLRHLRRFRAFLAGVLSVVYFLTNGVFLYSAESNVWAARRKVLTASLPASFPSFPLPSTFKAAESHPLVRRELTPFPPTARKAIESIPPTSAQIRKILWPEHASVAKTVVFIQDVHSHMEAQGHIADVVDRLNQAGAGFVALEGAFEQIDYRAFEKVVPQETRREVADFLLRNKKISGPVHALLSSRFPPMPIEGIDQKDEYNANVDSYLTASRQTPRWLPQKSTEEFVFNPKLRAFDRMVRSYDQQKISLTEYASSLAKAQGFASGPLADYLDAAQLEASLSFANVEKDREQLVRQLSSILKPAELASLAEWGVAFRSGRITNVEFYDHFAALCVAHHVPMERYAAMKTYLKYLSVSERIDADALFENLRAVEESMYAALAVTPAEKQHVAVARRQALQKKLIAFALNSSEWVTYRRDSAGRDLSLTAYEDFYRHAERRDHAMSQNLIAKIKANKADTFVLVAGGFHTNGIVSSLLKNGIAVVVVSPRLTHAEESKAAAALSLFAQQKTPLEKLFEGQKLFLAPPPSASPGLTATLCAAVQERREPGSFRRILTSLAPALQKASSVLWRTPTRLLVRVGRGVIAFRFAKHLESARLVWSWPKRTIFPKAAMVLALGIFGALPAQDLQSILNPVPPKQSYLTTLEGRVRPEMILGVDGEPGAPFFARSAGTIVLKAFNASQWNGGAPLSVQRDDVIVEVSNAEIDQRINVLKAEVEPLVGQLKGFRELASRPIPLMPRDELLRKEMEVLSLQGELRRWEYQRQVMGVLRAPSDAILIPNTRRSGDVKPGDVVARFLPRTQIRISLEIPKSDFQPGMDIMINGKPAVISKLHASLIPERNRVVLIFDLVLSAPVDSPLGEVGYQIKFKPIAPSDRFAKLQSDKSTYAVVGSRDTFTIPAPLFAGRLQFTSPEMARVEPNSDLGTVSGGNFYDELFAGISRVAADMASLQKDIDRELRPQGAIPKFDTLLSQLGGTLRPLLTLKTQGTEQNHITSPAAGLLSGSLPYSGQLVAQSNPQMDIAKVLGHTVTIPHVIVPKETPLNRDDVVLIQTPWGQICGTVFEIHLEAARPNINMPEMQGATIKVNDPNFLLHPNMPVQIRFLKPQDQAEARVLLAETSINRLRTAYPIEFQEVSGSESVQWSMWTTSSGVAPSESGASTTDQLLQQVLRDINPENRFAAFDQLLTYRGSDNTVFHRVITEGDVDVASLAIAYLRENHRAVELINLLMTLQSASRPEVSALVYQNLRTLLETRDVANDALVLIAAQSRQNPMFRSIAQNILLGYIKAEGISAPVSQRLLRAESDNLFWTDGELRILETQLLEAGENDLAHDIHTAILARTALSLQQTRFGYGAHFIDALLFDQQWFKTRLGAVRVNSDLERRYVLWSSQWPNLVGLNPSTQERVRATTPDLPVSSHANDSNSVPNFSAYVGGLNQAHFRVLTYARQVAMINALGAKETGLIPLSLLLADPQIRNTFVGNITEILMRTVQGRLLLARIFAAAPDAELMRALDNAKFDTALLGDVALEIQKLESLAEGAPSDISMGWPTSTRLKIYQDALLALRNVAKTDKSKFMILVKWVSLFPSSFELNSLKAEGVDSTDLAMAVRYVQELRAVQFAIWRAREKRSDTKQVAVQAGGDEILFQEFLQMFAPSQPIEASPIGAFENLIFHNIKTNAQFSPDDALASRDALNIADARLNDVVSTRWEYISHLEVIWRAVAWTSWFLWLLLIAPLRWLWDWAVFAVRIRTRYVVPQPEAIRLTIHRLSSRIQIEIKAPYTDVGDKLEKWLKLLKDRKPGSMEEFVQMQLYARDILNRMGIVFNAGGMPSNNGNGVLEPTYSSSNTSAMPGLLSIISDVMEVTALTLAREALDLSVDWTRDQKIRTYHLFQWFADRTTYFSLYRHIVDLFGYYHFVIGYQWPGLYLHDLEGATGFTWAFFKIWNPIKLAFHFMAVYFIAWPIRLFHLFIPAKIAARYLVLKKRLPQLAEIGNRVEPGLYSDVPIMVQRVDEGLRTLNRDVLEVRERAGPGVASNVRKIATRFLPVIAIMTGAGANIVALFLEKFNVISDVDAWNIRSIGVYPIVGGLAWFIVTMVLHWMQFLRKVWVPSKYMADIRLFAKVSEQVRPRLISESDALLALSADEGLRNYYYAHVVNSLHQEKLATDPVLDVFVLLLEDSTEHDQYKSLLASLLNPKTMIIILDTGQNNLEGGDAQLMALRYLKEPSMDAPHGEYARRREADFAKYRRLPERFEATRTGIMLVGKNSNALRPLPVKVTLPDQSQRPQTVALNSFILAAANIAALANDNFVLHNRVGDQARDQKLVGSVVLPHARLYLGSTQLGDTDDKEKFVDGVRVVGAYQSIEAAEDDSVVVFDQVALAKPTREGLQELWQTDRQVHDTVDLTNNQKRQLPTAQIVVTRFRSPDHYNDHLSALMEYETSIRQLRDGIRRQIPSDAPRRPRLGLHQMRQLWALFLFAHRGGNLDHYVLDTLARGYDENDPVRRFNQGVISKVRDLMQHGRLPSVTLAITNTARARYVKDQAAFDEFLRTPTSVFPSNLIDRDIVDHPTPAGGTWFWMKGLYGIFGTGWIARALAPALIESTFVQSAVMALLTHVMHLPLYIAVTLSIVLWQAAHLRPKEIFSWDKFLIGGLTGVIFSLVPNSIVSTVWAWMAAFTVPHLIVNTVAPTSVPLRKMFELEFDKILSGTALNRHVATLDGRNSNLILLPSQLDAEAIQRVRTEYERIRRSQGGENAPVRVVTQDQTTAQSLRRIVPTLAVVVRPELFADRDGVVHIDGRRLDEEVKSLQLNKDGIGLRLIVPTPIAIDLADVNSDSALYNAQVVVLNAILGSVTLGLRDFDAMINAALMAARHA